MTYSGSTGHGIDGLTVLEGQVAGLMYGPVRIGGKATVLPDGRARLDLALHALAEGTTVTGAPMEPDDRPMGHVFLDPTEWAGKPFSIRMDGGDIEVVLTKLQPL